jgi:hypothetical protein
VLRTLATTPYTSLTDCFFDSLANGLVFVSSSAASTSMWLYDVSTLSEKGSTSFNEGYFDIDPSFSIISMTDSSIVNLYQASSPFSCPSGSYADVSQACRPCLPNCTTCADGLTCTGC